MPYAEMVAACALALLAGSPSPGTLTVTSAHEYPPQLCRIIARNSGHTAVALDAPEISEASGRALPFLWVIAEPRVLRPGGSAIIQYHFDGQRRSPARSPNVRHTLKAKDATVTYDLLGPPPLAATYLVHDAASQRAYLYLRNLGAKDCSIAKLRIAGIPLALAASVTIPAETTNLAAGAWTPPASSEYAVPWVIVDIESPELGTLAVPARLFAPEHTPTLAKSDLPMFVACLSHKFDSLAEAGARAVERADAEKGNVRTTKFCNVDLATSGTADFGALAERCRIEPQTTYVHECQSGTYVSPILKLALRTKNDVAPGVFVTVLYGEYIHENNRPLFGVSVIRNVAYTCLAAGSKGFVFEPMVRTDVPPEFQNGLDLLTKELDRLQPLVAHSEPVDWVRTDRDAWCTPSLLLCGDESMLLIALPRQTPQSKASRSSAALQIDLPPVSFTLGTEAQEVGGIHEQIPVVPVASHHEIYVPPSEEARVFFIQLQTRPN